MTKVGFPISFSIALQSDVFRSSCLQPGCFLMVLRLERNRAADIAQFRDSQAENVDMAGASSRVELKHPPQQDGRSDTQHQTASARPKRKGTKRKAGSTKDKASSAASTPMSP